MTRAERLRQKMLAMRRELMRELAILFARRFRIVGRRRIATKCPSCGWQSEPVVFGNLVRLDRIADALNGHMRVKHPRGVLTSRG